MGRKPGIQILLQVLCVGSLALIQGKPKCKINPEESTRNKVLNKTDTIDLHCASLTETPFENILWSKTTASGQRKQLKQFKGLQKIQLKNLTLRDTGEYYCKINNITECWIEIHINSKPVIERCTSTPMALIIGERASFYCRAKGWPPPSTKWLFNGKEVIEEAGMTSIRKKAGVLKVTIHRMSEKFEGFYTFVAENKFGSETRIVRTDVHSADAHVESPKRPAPSPNVTLLKEGLNVTLNCRVISAKRAEVYDEWVFYPHCSSNVTNYHHVDNKVSTAEWNGSEVNFSLHLVNVTMANMGCYKCCLNLWQEILLLASDDIKPRTCATIQISINKRAAVVIEEDHNIIKVTGGVVAAVLGLCLLSYLLFKATKQRSCCKRGKGNAHRTHTRECSDYKVDVFVLYRSKDADSWVKEPCLSTPID